MATEPRVIESSSAESELEDFRALQARLLAGAAERIHASVERAQQLGLIDEHGNLLFTDLPEDMQPGAERDFGG
jgi:hypothetical protein